MDLGLDYDFRLADPFIDQYQGRQPEWGPIGYITYKRTYSREKSDGTHEEYWETCRRVVEGAMSILLWHWRRNAIEHSLERLQVFGQRMFRKMWEFKFLPPGRGLWMMGTEPIRKYGGAPLLNCAFTSTKRFALLAGGHVASTEDLDYDFASPFVWLMDLSMLGVGVGGDCRGAGKIAIQQPVIDANQVHVVEDSREGWCAVVRRVLNAYVGVGSLPAFVDYSQVRPAGAPIKGFGGTAAGPEPLIRLVEDIKRTLNPLIGRPITSAAIVDLFNFVGKAVVSGNVRRSAEIMFSEPEDEEFLSLKDPTQLDAWTAELAELKEAVAVTETGRVDLAEMIPDLSGEVMDRVLVSAQKRIAELGRLIEEHPLRDRRWASNNSVFARVGMDYARLAAQTARNGEPGYVWMETARAYGRLKDPPTWADAEAEGTNPCVEQTLFDEEGCNLVESFPSRHASLEEFLDTLEVAYVYGKIVTLLPVHHARMNAVMQRNRRIGISMSGITEALTRFGTKAFFEWCDKGYEFLRKLDEHTSSQWKINPSIKLTSVKPSGTVSLLPGVSPGIHYPHDEFIIRNVRFAADSQYVPVLRDAGYVCEPCVYTPNTTVVSFPVKEKWFSRAKHDIPMLAQLELAAKIQYFWADNQVSATITFTPAEAKQIELALDLYQDRLKGISFLPLEHGYAQAPYISITKEEYGRLAANTRPYVLEETSNEVVEKFCDGDKCELPSRVKKAVAS